jgi:hypothetical protein
MSSGFAWLNELMIWVGRWIRKGNRVPGKGRAIGSSDDLSRTGKDGAPEPQIPGGP